MGKTIISPVIAPGRLLKNKIINGAMRIDQRYEGATLNVGNPLSNYIVDRWALTGQNADGVLSGRRNGIGGSIPGFLYCFTIQTVTADASIGASQRYVIFQAIEGYNIQDLDWGTSYAKPVTLSFWVSSSLTGTHSGSLTNSTIDRSYPFTYTINQASTWEYKTITVPGPTSGGWELDNDGGIYLWFDLGTGSTLRGTAGAWANADYRGVTGAVSLVSTLNANWNITGVQLEPGVVATPFEHRLYTEELIICQRYCEKSYSELVVPGTAASAGTVRGSRQNGGFHASGTWKVNKRGGVTVTFYSPSTGTSGKLFNNSSSADENVTTYSAASNGYDVVGTTATIGQMVSWQYLATSEL